MIYCSLIERELNDKDIDVLKNQDVLIFSSFVKHEKVLYFDPNKNNNYLSLNYILNLKNFIKEDEYYFIDLSNCDNYDKFLENKNNLEEFKLLDNTEADIYRIFCNLKDRINFIKKYGEYHKYRFPLIIKGSIFNEIVKYISLFTNYDVFTFQIECFFAIIRMFLND